MLLKPSVARTSMKTYQLSVSVMVVLGKNVVLLHTLDISCAMPTVCRMFWCHRSGSTPSGLCAAFSSRSLPSVTARTRLLSSQNKYSSHILFPPDRCGAHLNCYRQSSTSSTEGSDIVGKIQSTHYHLIYTCKVIIEMWLLLGLYFFAVVVCVLMFWLHHLCRCVLPGPRRRYPSRPIITVLWLWLVQDVRITISSLITSTGSPTWKGRGWYNLICPANKNQPDATKLPQPATCHRADSS